jgi:BirA family biotin operon repressor/biotin-[acetyl-CoA-carboxylase] ligase
MVNEKVGPDARDLEILAALRAGRAPVSGQVLAARLGMSRVALWKRIERLRGFAYRIEGGRGGYRLLEEDAVVSGAFPDGRGVIYCAATASTMDEAWALAERGAGSGTLVIADRQSAGRGRQGRPWHSPGGGLYLTLVLRPRLPACFAAALVLEGACGLCEWLEGAGCRLGFHWPNDLMAGTRKVGGLLAELAGPPEAPRFYLLGLGLNLGAPERLRRAGAGLADLMIRPPLRRDLAAAFRDHLAAWAEAPRLRPGDWERRCPFLGAPVEFLDWQGRLHAGLARGFDPRGGLRLADPAGGLETTYLPDEVRRLRVLAPEAGPAAGDARSRPAPLPPSPPETRP